MHNLRLHLLRGSHALDALRDASFRADWQRLHCACPWATPYQSLSFVDAWVKHYASQGELVLAVGNDAAGTVRGVLGLICVDGVLNGIGRHQAEYHAWLCDPDTSQSFVVGAIDELGHAFPECEIHLTYLAPDLDPAALFAGLDVEKRVRWIPHRRPLMRIDADDLAKSIRKKSNKSRFNRLKKLGEFSFQRIRDPDRFLAELDQISVQYDIRQGAVNDCAPFADDPHKKAFHVDWMRNSPDELHVTTTKVDNQLVAAHLGAVGHGVVHLAIISHSPLLAKHSPGKLHIMQLGQLFVDEGIATLDLTPGGDPWKDRFCNDEDQVWELVVCTSANARRRAEFGERILQSAKQSASRLGMTPTRIRALLARTRTLVSGKGTLPDSSAELGRQTFQIARSEIPERTASADVRRDDLDALLNAGSAQGNGHRREFLYGSLDKLERGAHCYTMGHRVGWLSERPVGLSNPEFSYPQGSARLHDFSANDSDEPLSEEMLLRMLGDLREVKDVCLVYIDIPEEDTTSQVLLEKIGFAQAKPPEIGASDG